MKNKNWRSLGWCEYHDKQLYLNRKIAKEVCRLHQGEHKSPFPCVMHEGLWHIGGLPQSIISGRYSRDDLYPGRAA
jgi:hypothetical protein